MKKALWVMGLLLVGCSGAAGQTNSKGDIFAGYSFARLGDRAIFPAGYQTAFAAYLKGGYAEPPALAVEFGQYRTSKGAERLRLSTYALGPRCYFYYSDRSKIFGQATFGVAQLHTHVAGLARREKSFAMTIGMGYDRFLCKHIALRVAQVDYVMTHFGREFQNGVRYSGGVVFYLGGN